MLKKGFIVTIGIMVILCLGLTLTGCPKKTVVKEEPSVTARSEEARRLEAERAAKEAAEREAREKETREKEIAKLREEEARKEEERKELARKEEERKELARKEEERKELERREQEKREQERKEFEKSLVAKKTPGIEGQVYESSLLKDIHFDFDRYDIRPKDAEVLKENAALLKKFTTVKIQVEGHCDERGTNEYNLALGERRANSTKKYLISVGIAADRIATISYGEEKPLDPAHYEEAWQKNRRAHFVILSK